MHNSSDRRGLMDEPGRTLGRTNDPRGPLNVQATTIY